MSTRASAVFLTAFSLLFGAIYLYVMGHNLAAFTYHPRSGEWGLGIEAPRNGPVMFLYGWIATSAALAVAGAVLALVVRRLVPAVWWLRLGWMVPVVASVISIYLMSPFFLR